MTWEWWDRLATMDTELLSRDGTAILRFQKHWVDFVLEFAQLGTLWGKKAAMVNSSLFSSEIGNELCVKLGVEMGVIWYIDAVGRYHYSLRASQDGVNVHEVAAHWGGGGHPKAAGFLTDTQVSFDK
jgi:nanoRNase/pAp phosphatase (c-di-AMP/oligoRNAs hydrolase)